MTRATPPTRPMITDLRDMQARLAARLDDTAQKILQQARGGDDLRPLVLDILRTRCRLGSLKKQGIADITAAAKNGSAELAELFAAEQTKRLFTPRQEEEIAAATQARPPSPRLDKIFGAGGRVYLTFPPDIISATQQEVTVWLENLGLVMHDYAAGHARGHAPTPLRIGKLMQKHPVPDYLKTEFENDPTRNRNLRVVISRHPRDIARVSTGRDWHTCLSALDTQWGAVPRDIEKESLVAYIIKDDDPDITAPLARIRILPYVRSTGLRGLFNQGADKQQPEVIYMCSPQVGLRHDVFEAVVADFCATHLNHGQDGAYRLKNGVYDGGVMPQSARKANNRVMPGEGLF